MPMANIFDESRPQKRDFWANGRRVPEFSFRMAPFTQDSSKVKRHAGPDPFPTSSKESTHFANSPTLYTIFFEISGCRQGATYMADVTFSVEGIHLKCVILARNGILDI